MRGQNSNHASDKEYAHTDCWSAPPRMDEMLKSHCRVCGGGDIPVIAFASECPAEGEFMSFEWWHWIVLGFVLVVAELAVPAFFIIWFGLGALLVGLLLLVAPAMSMTLQLALWCVASLGMVVLWFRIFKRGDHKTRIGQSDGDTIGEIGLMAKAAAPFARGRVRFQKPLLGSEEWECVVDEAIAAGERVRVVSVEGSFLKVQKV
jgi:inner membrane protein